MVDYYKILGIPRNADSSTIKRAYHKMARKYHPDKNRDNPEDTTERFKQIKEAYEVLNDNERRRIYDLHGINGLKRANSGGGGNPFNNMFNQMFRGNPFGNFRMNMNMNVNMNKRRRGSNVVHTHFYTLEDLYKRVPLVLQYERMCICSNCKGLGVEDSRYINNCDKCGGQGMINKVIQLGPGMIQQSTTTCDKCRGEGKYITPGHNCKVCSGRKKVKKMEILKLDCPNDITNGSMATLSGRGNEEPDGITGNLEVHFREKPHAHFIRCKNNLLYKRDVSLGDALLGFKYEIKHLDGRVINIEECNILQNTSTYMIPGEGFNGGDLYIKYNIIFPKSLDEKEREILETIFPRGVEDERVSTRTVELRENIPTEIKEKL